MQSTFKDGMIQVATPCFIASILLQGVVAIAPETATHGFTQAGKSKTSWSFWSGVLGCIAALFTIIGVVVAVMQLLQSRRNQTLSRAPMQQQMRTLMQRRSRVHYMVVEEETVHRIDDMV